MSKIDENIQAVDAVRAHYSAALNQLKAAKDEAEDNREQSDALGAEGLVELFSQAKSSLEALEAATTGLDQKLDDVIAILKSGKG